MGDNNRSYGVVGLGFPVISGKAPSPYGRTWFVDAKIGSDGNRGNRPDRPFLTMAKAFATIDSGDVIITRGKVREQLVTPVGVFDVIVSGGSTRPRHADDHSEASSPGRGSSGATWMAPASGGTAAQATVRVLQQGWRFENILFAAIDTNAAMIEIVRNAASGDDERDASHAEVLGCKFAGAGVGIRSGVAGSFTENTTNVLVQGNTFLSNTTAIRQTTGFGGLNWQIVDNVFITNTNDIVGPFTGTKILRNSMSLAPTGCIVLTGGGTNGVHLNNLPGTYANGTLYAPGTSDNWNGNAASTGFTAAVPA